jgi:hypothetical protein
VRNIEQMQSEFSEAIAVIAYNLDFDGYRYLKTYGPVVHELVGGSMQVEWFRELEWFDAALTSSLTPPCALSAGRDQSANKAESCNIRSINTANRSPTG